jgi:hypothetical protein
MAFRRTNQFLTPTHWSEAFVEHLRTVHFALIATAAALIVVALTTKPFSTEVANYELHRLLYLKQHWSATFVRNEFGIEITTKDPKKQSLDAFGKRFDVELSPVEKALNEIPINQDCCFVEDDHEDVDHPRGEDVHAQAHFPTDTVYISTTDYGGTAHASDVRVPPMPGNLREIGLFWATLDDENMTLYYPEAIDNIGLLTNVENFDSKIQLSPAGSAFYNFLFPVGEDKKHPVSMKLERVSEISEQDSHPQNLVLRFTGEYDQGQEQSKQFEIHALVTTYVYSELDGAGLARYLQVKSPKFDRAFYDLLQVADKDGVTTLPELSDILTKSELSETPVFEAFGIKFPTDLATLGGTVVLLSVQVYFFVYLRRLYGSLRQDDPGWDVPWIGMDSSGLARTIFLITVVILPALSLVILGREAAIRMTRVYWDWVGGIFHHDPVGAWSWPVKFKLLGLIVSVILSGCLGALSWRYRPRIAATSASTMWNLPA